MSKSSIISTPKRLDASNVAGFKVEGQDLLESSNKGIIVDFEKTTFIDSAGLGSLVSLLKHAAQDNKKVVLASLTPQVKQIFELTKLYRIFDITESIADGETVISK